MGPDYLVMELLEGETLAARLSHGPLPLHLAIRYGAQVADALAAAHAKGIIHRDLKPGNIMVTKSTAKVLDFGLAKSAIASELSVDGAILGTPAYMAPEQLAGRLCNERTDIYALGLILHEMAAGRQPEPGNRPPGSMEEWPPQFAHVVERCLESDPEERWHSARDVKAELEWAARNSVVEQIPAGRKSRRTFAIAALLATLIVAGTGLVMRQTWIGAPQPFQHVSILPPQGLALNQHSGSRLSLSPDGRRLAISAGDRLWLRSLDHESAEPLPGTEGGAAPFWSPDGNQLGFFARNKLKRIALSGGPPVTLADTRGKSGGSWNRDGVIVFAGYGAPLQRVSVSGGTPVPVTTLDKESGETNQHTPFFLPDGHHFLYTTLGTKTGGPFGAKGFYVGSLSSRPPKLILPGAFHVEYAQGYLFYVRQDALLAQKFDLGRLELTGEAVVIAKEIRTDVSTNSFPGAAVSVSPAGVLAYQSGPALPPSQLIWFDRYGRKLGVLGETALYATPTLSPDGERAAATVRDHVNGTQDIWIFDLARGVSTRFTTSGDVSGITWSPDGNHIAFTARRDGTQSLYQKATSGMGNEQLLWKDTLTKHQPSWSPAGGSLVYNTGIGTPLTGSDVWALPLSGDGKPFPFVRTAFQELTPTFSPDGRWVAYNSDESGQHELYVSPFPGPGRRSRISPNGAERAKWRRDGRELYYLAPDNKMMAVPVDGRGSVFEIGGPEPLFEIPGTARGLDVTSDGKRFLVNTVAKETFGDAITLVLNWPALLARQR